ncbi:integral membrane protein [Kwoniella mangroviensis CBS 10435]|uniref:Integral membrane protein n=1 Tax=Kwoniella mangroviensis CBS 10435 TaxID=1331196 RepID=A0A1B9IEZ4_9TREE|nr:uncharacterized protein I203_05081 [Kwoniella mangroviensis CBS 8507]OCF54136.1 integral membrane protein [Kwoniella mangroviensis CBS 10435]OCF66057.1 integral membrane protein [Kwoniella mangroviensis CBS 8507]OCF71868.1 integral membrane protein [Kwoniella mangroviensis CBS 8886]
MKERPGAENALATIGAVMWMVQIIPQIIKSHRTKSTTGLSAGLMSIWALASIFLGSYVVAQRLSIPLQIQPQAFGVLAAISTGQILYYSHKWSKRNTILFFVGFCLVFAGFETGSVFAIWAGQDNGVNWPIKMYGIISAVLLAIALAPQYYEIWKFREVLGISMMFMIVDTLGGVFSLASLFCRSELDILGLISYALVVVLDTIVILLAIILNPLARRRRRKHGKPENIHDALAADASTAEEGNVKNPPSAAGDGMGEGLGKSVSQERREKEQQPQQNTQEDPGEKTISSCNRHD